MRLFHNVILITLLSFLSATAFALEEDSKARIYIVSDTTAYNYKSGFTLFEGHVKVDQGTTHLTADKLTTQSDANHKIQEAIAYGIKQPAHYWTIPKKGDMEVHATAMVIKFYPLNSNVTLEQNVLIKQGENSFQGQLIHYNRSAETIIVPANKNGRSVLIYNPDKKSL